MTDFTITCDANSFSKTKNAQGVQITSDYGFENNPIKGYLKVSLLIQTTTAEHELEGQVKYSVTYPLATDRMHFTYFQHARNTLFAECNKVLLVEYGGRVLHYMPNDQELLALVKQKLSAG